MGFLKKLFGREEKEVKQAPVPPPQPELEPLNIHEISADELKSLLDQAAKITVVDLRQPWEYSGGHIPGAVNIPMMQLPGRISEISKEHTVVMQCYHGFSSLDASGFLIENGWDEERINSLSGGMAGWVASQGADALDKSA
jgi:rhodanese-related sulfurtransferase